MDENKTTIKEDTNTAPSDASSEAALATEEASEEASTDKEVSEETDSMEDASEKATSEEISDETSSEADPCEDTAEDCTAGKSGKKVVKKVLLMLLICISALIVVCAGVILAAGLVPQNIEAGDTLILRAERLPVISRLYTVSEDISAVDTSVTGTKKIKLLLFYRIPLNATVTVRDTTPPTVTVFDEVLIPRGSLTSPIDFIRAAVDATPLEFQFASVPDTSSDGSVVITVSDEGANTVTLESRYLVSDELSDVSFEYGINSNFLSAQISSLFGIDSPDLKDVDFNTCGSYRASGYFGGIRCAFGLNIADTTAPTAIVKSLDLLSDQSIGIDDIVTEVLDMSEVNIICTPELDLSNIGSTEYEITLEDVHGNSSSYTAYINIHNLDSAMVIEAGTTADELANTLSALLGTGEEAPKLSDMFKPERLKLGTYETELIGKYSTMPLEITIEDTTPPDFELRKMTVYIGTVPSPADLVVECIDATDVSFEFEYAPDVSKIGNFLVGVKATDSSGNTATEYTTIKVSDNNVPPVIYGVKAITAYEGDTISFRSGVYAIDDKDGRVTVTANTSGVNIYAPGTYYVVYSASDEEGNTATAKASVTIKAITAAAVNEKADKILSEIVTNSMTDTEKARAIYDWCRKNLKYSTITSYLMGYFNKAAYSGFTRYYGNCYTYYAVASSLLTRAGITNTVIQRNNAKNPHYWNLVKIDGSWYHLDTCPQPAPHKLEVFLLTDSELQTFTLDYYYKFAPGVYPKTP